MTGTEKAKIEFQNRFDAVKNYYKWTNKDVAKHLRISTRSVTTLRNNPFNASGENLMKIMALYKGMEI